jgi:hypothetical protein
MLKLKLQKSAEYYLETELDIRKSTAPARARSLRLFGIPYPAMPFGPQSSNLTRTGELRRVSSNLRFLSIAILYLRNPPVVKPVCMIVPAASNPFVTSRKTQPPCARAGL